MCLECWLPGEAENGVRVRAHATPDSTGSRAECTNTSKRPVHVLKSNVRTLAPGGFQYKAEGVYFEDVIAGRGFSDSRHDKLTEKLLDLRNQCLDHSQPEFSSRERLQILIAGVAHAVPHLLEMVRSLTTSLRSAHAVDRPLTVVVVHETEQGPIEERPLKVEAPGEQVDRLRQLLHQLAAEQWQ
jgi:hypothetical protein